MIHWLNARIHTHELFNQFHVNHVHCSRLHSWNVELAAVGSGVVVEYRKWLQRALDDILVDDALSEAVGHFYGDVFLYAGASVSATVLHDDRLIAFVHENICHARTVFRSNGYNHLPVRDWSATVRSDTKITLGTALSGNSLRGESKAGWQLALKLRTRGVTILATAHRAWLRKPLYAKRIPVHTTFKKARAVVATGTAIAFTWQCRVRTCRKAVGYVAACVRLLRLPSLP